MVDTRSSWRCAKKSLSCPGRLYTMHETFHCISESHRTIDKVKQMASTSQTTNHRIYCALTGTLPPATMSRRPGEDAVKKIAGWKICQIPSCFLESDGQSRDQLEQDNNYCNYFNKTFYSVADFCILTCLLL